MTEHYWCFMLTVFLWFINLSFPELTLIISRNKCLKTTCLIVIKPSIRNAVCIKCEVMLYDMLLSDVIEDRLPFEENGQELF